MYIQPIVWSKYRIDQELDKDKVLDRFKGRFSNIIPLEKCDLILLKEEEIPKKEEIPKEIVVEAAEADANKLAKAKK